MRRNAIDDSINIHATQELCSRRRKCEIRNTRLRFGEPTKPHISSSSKPHSKTKKPSRLMGSKTERGLQSASIHPSFPTQTTSLVAKLRLNPKPTIPIVGRVRTKNHITRRNATLQKIASLKKYSFPRTDPIHDPIHWIFIE
jgi:hypothetical protein